MKISLIDTPEVETMDGHKFKIARFRVSGEYMNAEIDETIEIDYGLLVSIGDESMIENEANQFLGDILDCIDGTFIDDDLGEGGMGAVLSCMFHVFRPNRLSLKLIKSDKHRLWPNLNKTKKK